MNSQRTTNVPVNTEGRLPNLDGLRALCILSVLGGHCIHLENFPDRFRGEWFFIFDGNLGVRFFFLISGFIITWLLLREGKLKGKINLREFWCRRAVRILPAYVFFLIALLVLQYTTKWGMGLQGWVGALTFTANYNTLGQWLPAHLWSLSVEEQFYLTWPLVIVFLQPWVKGELALLCLVGVIIGCCIFQWYAASYGGSVLIGSYSFLLNSDSIASGCFGAILLWHNRQALADFFLTWRLGAILIFLLAIITPKLLQAAQLIPPGNYPGKTALQAFGLLGVLLWSQLLPRHAAFRLLEVKPIVAIGTWSYSIYLWQQIFSAGPRAFGFGEGCWWLDFPGWLIPVFLFGLASFYLIEQPIRQRFRTRLKTAKDRADQDMHGGVPSKNVTDI